MKTLRFVLWLSLFAGSIMVQAADDARREDRLAIEHSESEWAHCFQTGDPKKASVFIANDFVGVNAEGKTYVKTEALDEIARSKGRYRIFKNTEIAIRFYGETTAVAQGVDTWTNTESPAKSGRSVWTDMWIKQDGSWRVVAAQDVDAAEPVKSP